MDDVTVHIGVLYVDLFIGGAQSLKDKRMALKPIKDKVRTQFNVSVAELDRQDKWQRSTMAFAMIGPDQRHIDGTLQKILFFIEGYHAVAISEKRVEFY